MLATEQLLKLLRDGSDGYLSGEELSARLGVSRTAVWKHIHQLEQSGYRIAAMPHLGYQLLESPDLLLPEEIRAGLQTRLIGRQIACFKETTSTNDRALELAGQGAPEGTLVAAESQTQGRGRYQRTWLAKPSANLLFSIIFRPAWTLEQTPLIALLLAIAVARAIRSQTGLESLIKWPNDILIQGGKVCGILTEMRTQADLITWLVCGIGINVNAAPAGPLKNKAVSLSGLAGHPWPRLPLLRAVLKEIEDFYLAVKKEGWGLVLQQWPLWSCTPPGTQVRLDVPGSESLEGTAMGIDETGALLIRLENGMIRRYSSGEVSLIVAVQ